MQSLVVDASVAVKWFVDEAQSAMAGRLLAADARHIAPDIILVEVANALRKKVLAKELSIEQARRSLHVLPDMLSEVMDSASLTEAAFDMAVSVNHPVADCIYLALAEKVAAKCVTADIKMIERFAGSSHAARIVSLTEFNSDAGAEKSASTRDAKH